MKKVGLTLLVATATSLGIMILSSCGGKTGTSSLKTSADSAAYALGIANGYGMGEGIANFPGEKLDLDLIAAALRDGLKGDTSLMHPRDAQGVFQAYMMKAQQEQEEANKTAGEKFLEENKSKDGVRTTDSGLQYKVTEEGTGATPNATDTVVVHYKGTLLSGEVFDSSYDRGEPAEFPLNQVIPGWTEGLQLMKEGSKFTLWIPADLAYGPRPLNEEGGYQTLMFECELLEVKPAVEK